MACPRFLFRIAGLALVSCGTLTGSAAAQTYYPAPESQGGWRSLVSPNTVPSAAQQATIREQTSVEWSALESAWQRVQGAGGDLLVIRGGWVVGEWGTGAARTISSCTKALTSLAMKRLYDLSDAGTISVSIDEDSPAWPFLPSGWSAGDPAKQAILLRQLATMTSGLEPHDAPTKTSSYRSLVLSLPVVAPPDAEWVYASAPVDLLSLVVEGATGGTLASFFAAELAGPLGMESMQWAAMGASTLGSAFASAKARDLARVGYLLMHDGRWDSGQGEQQLVSAARVETLRSYTPQAVVSQFGPSSSFTNDPDSNLRFGRLVWTVNLDTDYVSSSLPSRSFYMAGHGTNFCVVVPEYDLIVVRLGTGPAPWADDMFVDVLDRVMAGVLDRQTHARVAYGAGGCGPSATPLLFVTPPRLGEPFTIALPAIGSGAFHLLLYGFPAAAPIPFDTACAFGIEFPPLGYVDMGGAELVLPVPGNATLAGVQFALQSLVSEGGAVSLSETVELRLGN